MSIIPLFLALSQGEGPCKRLFISKGGGLQWINGGCIKPYYSKLVATHVQAMIYPCRYLHEPPDNILTTLM